MPAGRKQPRNNCPIPSRYNKEQIRQLAQRSISQDTKDLPSKDGHETEDVAQQFASACADIIDGQSDTLILKKYGAISKRDLSFLKRWTNLSSDEFNSAIVAVFEKTQARLLESLFLRVDEIPAQNIAYALSIVTDKLATVQGRPSSITANVGIKLKDSELTADRAIEVLTS